MSRIQWTLEPRYCPLALSLSPSRSLSLSLSPSLPLMRALQIKLLYHTSPPHPPLLPSPLSPPLISSVHSGTPSREELLIFLKKKYENRHEQKIGKLCKLNLRRKPNCEPLRRFKIFTHITPYYSTLLSRFVCWQNHNPVVAALQYGHECPKKKDGIKSPKNAG